ncbi:DUF3261 domain-containing protein [Pseudocolwellia sp. HL-MZ19]|uniref:DUF3261 domain-containing protein n=1 Tax=Pseudocolwellia sp. HL-MZ19 TaxID=3400846 RepID=UPI003CF7AFE0
MRIYSLLKKFKLAILITVLITLLSACSSLFTSKVSQGDFYTLQAVPETLVGTSVLESIVFKNKQTQKLLTQVEYYEQSLNMVAMTYSGLPIIQAKWHQYAGLVDLVSAQFSQDLVLQFIRDIQWVKWPVSSIKKGLSAEYSIIESIENGHKVREIKHKKHVFVKVTYTAERVILENKAEQYELLIEQLNDK